MSPSTSASVTSCHVSSSRVLPNGATDRGEGAVTRREEGGPFDWRKEVRTTKEREDGIFRLVEDTAADRAPQPMQQRPTPPAQIDLHRLRDVRER